MHKKPIVLGPDAKTQLLTRNITCYIVMYFLQWFDEDIFRKML